MWPGQVSLRAQSYYSEAKSQSDPAFKERQRAYNKAFYAVISDMLMELKSLAEIQSGAGKPSYAQIMLMELERGAGI